MSDDEVRKYLDRLAEYTKKVTVSSSTSKQLLEKAGICTPGGKLKRPYSIVKK